MRFSISKLKKILISDKSLDIISASFFGLIGFLLVKDFFTPLLLAGRGFGGRNLFIKISLFSFYFVVYVLLYFLIQWLFKQAKSLIKPLPMNNVLNPQNDKFSKIFFVALITFVLGVLIIFLINNIVYRIDTEKWRLTGLDIIQTIEPIGNDFRVGLYLPAENLVKSGFKAIGPNGTYPSVYPPLVGVLSLVYLLFNVQTAYLVNTALLILLNFLILLIAILMVDELVLVKVIQDKFIRKILSLLLFVIIAFYNFSSYSFLFSIERGNVDVIPMFFMMLAMWTLIKQPKNIWLQVIFLSIATHYKIYPAILFLVLFYRHGKKLILPALVINVAFLFILGPKIALAFITSLMSGSSGAGVGNQWTWIGNHSANSFAKILSLIYPRFANDFLTLFIVCMLIPFSIWVQGTIRILRHKYTPLNAILLFMITIPLMDLLPTISNDYRLIIESTTFLIFIGVNLSQTIQNPSWKQIIELLLVIIIMFFLSKPYDMAYQYSNDLQTYSTFIIDNKFLWCLALEGLLVLNIIENEKNNPLLNT